MLLLRDYGTMRLADVLSPAIYYAGQGHPLVERAHATIATVEELFRKYWPTSAAVYLPGGAVPETGTLFTNTTLAETYTRVLREAKSVGGDRVREIEAARKVWSQGFVAEAIDRFCRTQAVMDTSGTAHHGVLTGDDMAAERDVLELSTRKYGALTVGGNYAKVAEGLNVAATRVEKPGDIVPAIKDAVTVTQSGAPFLLEIVAKQGYDFSRYPPAGL